MKNVFVIALAVFAVLINVPVMAQTGAPLRGQSLNGSTGLYSIPTGRVGWETAGNFAVDFGYRAVINNDAGVAHIPAVSISLFKCVELSAAFDFQPENYDRYNRENNDLLTGIKFKLPTKNTAIAIGANVHFLNIESDVHNYNAYQPYLAITYPGTFFAMPAETTIVFGKTFYSGRDNNSNIDFGMGFDLVLFPDVFGNAVHWIIDFANFSYSDNAWPHYNNYYTTNAIWRGVFNTGFRIDLSTIPGLDKVKFLLDFVFNDLFDDGARSFTVGVVFGFSAP